MTMDTKDARISEHDQPELREIPEEKQARLYTVGPGEFFYVLPHLRWRAKLDRISG